MDIRKVTPSYSVSPQITPDELRQVADAGFTDVICNRPDFENPPELSAAAMRAAAEALGLTFHDNPVDNGGLTSENITRQAQILDEAPGPVFAYCRSGTRCTIVWALGQAGRQPAEQIIQAAAGAGYDIEGLRPQLQG